MSNDITIPALSQIETYPQFQDVCKEAKRRLIASVMLNERTGNFSYQHTADYLGYSNGGLHGLCKTLFNDPAFPSNYEGIKSFFKEQYKPIQFAPHEEEAISSLARLDHRTKLEAAIQAAEKILFENSLIANGFNLRATGRSLNTGHKTVHQKMDIHGIAKGSAEDKELQPAQQTENQGLTEKKSSAGMRPVLDRKGLIEDLSLMESYPRFKDVHQEAKRRLIANVLMNERIGKFSYQYTANYLGYSNGGLYGLCKTLFNAPDLPADVAGTKSYFRTHYTPTKFKPHEEDIIDALVKVDNRAELEAIIEAAEKKLFEKSLMANGFNFSATGRSLETSNKTVSDKAVKHGLSKPEADSTFITIEQLLANTNLKDLRTSLNTRLIAKALHDNNYDFGIAAGSIGVEKDIFENGCSSYLRIGPWHERKDIVDRVETALHVTDTPHNIEILRRITTYQQLNEILIKAKAEQDARELARRIALYGAIEPPTPHN